METGKDRKRPEETPDVHSVHAPEASDPVGGAIAQALAAHGSGDVAATRLALLRALQELG